MTIKSPFWLAVGISLLGLVLAALLVLGQAVLAPQKPAEVTVPGEGAPWHVALPEPGRSRVFGLSLPGSTLADVQQRWGSDVQLALISGAGREPVVEGYLERFEAGGVTGRLLLRLEEAGGGTQSLLGWQQELKGEPTESGAWRHVLTPAAVADLVRLRLVGLSFIPVAQLDAAMVQARFGAPAEQRADGERLTHWLYPALGLAVVLDSGGRELLQYVAPAEFDARLVRPLPPGAGAAAPGAPAAASSASAARP
jgi:hypothetical protein